LDLSPDPKLTDVAGDALKSLGAVAVPVMLKFTVAGIRLLRFQHSHSFAFWMLLATTIQIWLLAGLFLLMLVQTALLLTNL
jgi:hypothetical protein